MTESTPSPDPSLPWVDRVFLRVEVGSTAHGTGLPGNEDYDELGIMTMPWTHHLGLPVPSPSSETVVYRPGRGVGERSGPGDYDLQVYAARKFASLAAQGNPSILMMLFGPVRFAVGPGVSLRSEELIRAFWSERARARFLGYAAAQRERLLGISGGKHTNRPELIAAHGYDTKYAMHMLRLGIQGIEYMGTGRFTIPIPMEHGGELLRAVRRGEFTKEQVVALADRNKERLKSIASEAPAEPDYERINRWLAEVHAWRA